MKIVINDSYGGFSLLEKVYKELGIRWDGYGYLKNSDLGIISENRYQYRADLRLITAIEKIGIKKSSGRYSFLKIVEIPDCKEWFIEEYDGAEEVCYDVTKTYEYIKSRNEKCEEIARHIYDNYKDMSYDYIANLLKENFV